MEKTDHDALQKAVREWPADGVNGVIRGAVCVLPYIPPIDPTAPIGETLNPLVMHEGKRIGLYVAPLRASDRSGRDITDAMRRASVARAINLAYLGRAGYATDMYAYATCVAGVLEDWIASGDLYPDTHVPMRMFVVPCRRHSEVVRLVDFRTGSDPLVFGVPSSKIGDALSAHERGGDLTAAVADLIRDALEEAQPTAPPARAHAPDTSYNWTLADLRNANQRRQEAWPGNDKITPAFRGLELAGEMGEAANIVKKLERIRLGIAGSSPKEGPRLRARLAQELADLVICADLIAGEQGIDLMEAVPAKFDGTSEKYKIPSKFWE